ncbi:hypothetical protein [Aquimarina agarivorans]|uniref:hypothetical protein n=1 Tax=Aquimarina agarivorans TaxID=980584 RepID=UPI000248F912|nr:hypothetical protein [Aquimarina agarivorans]
MKEVALKIKPKIEVLVDSKDLKLIEVYCRELKIIVDDAYFETLGSLENARVFKTILHSFIFEKISYRISQLNNDLPPISVVNRKGVSINEKVIFNLKSFKEQLIRSYLPELNDLPEVKKFKEEQIKAKNAKRDFLLNPNYSYEGDEYVEEIQYKYFKKLIDKGFNDTKQFFKNLFDTTSDKQDAKRQLTMLIEEFNGKISRLDRAIVYYNEKLSYLGENLPTGGIENYVTPTGDKISVNSRESNIWKIAELSNELSNDEYLKQKLIDFKEYAFEVYPFLGEKLNVNSHLKKTVFGTFNYELLHNLYDEFCFFLGKETSKEKFVEVFTSFGNYKKSKINLTNGIGTDYGTIISKFYEYFEHNNFKRKSIYNSWWADRFTFNGVEKDIDGIGRIKSAKSSKNTSQIRLILQVLEQN